MTFKSTLESKCQMEELIFLSHFQHPLLGILPPLILDADLTSMTTQPNESSYLPMAFTKDTRQVQLSRGRGKLG